MDETDPDTILIVGLTIEHYGELLALWRRTPGICVADADSEEGIRRYLARNPGLSFIAMRKNRLVGSAMAGHDGRRGYLQHVVVDVDFRRRGIAQALVKRCLDGLAHEGILKTHLEVMVTNQLANRYWANRGWQRRDDINRFSMILGPSPNV